MFDSSKLFKEKGGTNIIYFNEDYKRNSKSNVKCKKIILPMIIDFAPSRCTMGLA